jgi:putative transposase
MKQLRRCRDAETSEVSKNFGSLCGGYMPRRTTQLAAGDYYHVYNRGNNRGEIFFENENYLFFLRRLREHLQPKSSETSEVFETSEVCTVVAYCLMPNHYHLLLQPNDDALSHHLQMFTISYTKAINKRFERVGTLFQGAFQAKRIDSDEYLAYLSCYIHLNPVWAGLAKRPEDWGFSSYRDYVGLRRGTLPNPSVILEQFRTREEYRKSVESFLPERTKKISHLLFEE